MKIQLSGEFVKCELTKVVKLVGINYELLAILNKSGLNLSVRDNIKNIKSKTLEQLGFGCVYNYYIGKLDNVKDYKPEFQYIFIKNPINDDFFSDYRLILKSLTKKLVNECAKRMPDEFDENGFSDWTSFSKKYLLCSDSKGYFAFIGFDRNIYRKNCATLWEIFVDKKNERQKNIFSDA